MGSIPSILVIVNNGFTSKSIKLFPSLRTFSKRTVLKHSKLVHTEVSKRGRLKSTKISKRSSNFLYTPVIRQWHVSAHRKHRSSKKLFTSIQSLSYQQKFDWVRGRLKIIKLNISKLFARPKMHVVRPLKRSIRFAGHRSRLKLLSGKNRGFISHKLTSTRLLKKNKMLLTKYIKTTTISNLRIKRKKWYSTKRARKLELIRTTPNVKSSRLQYHFNSEPPYIKTLPNTPLKGQKYKLKRNLKRVHWRMSTMNKKPQQSRNLAMYNSETASSFFKKKNWQVNIGVSTVPAYLLHYFIVTNNTPTNFTDFHISQLFSRPKPSLTLNMVPSMQLSQIVNTTSGSLKKLYKFEKKNFAHDSSTVKLNLQLPTTTDTNFNIPTWSHFLQQWLYEEAFVHRKTTLSKGAILVLSRVPAYKMDSFSPVNADRYRGNVHTKLGLVHDNLNHTVLKDKVSFLHLSRRSTFAALMSRKIRDNRKLNPIIQKKTLVDWSTLSYKNLGAQKIESLFLAECSILKYRPKFDLHTRKKSITSLISPMPSKTTLYSRIYSTSLVKSSKKRLSRSTTRRVKPKLYTRIRSKHVLKRHVLKAYKSRTLRQEQQLRKVKRLRWWKLPKLYRSYRRLCRVRKPRRLKITKLLNNNYLSPQNTHYSHEPSTNPKHQRKGEELLISTAPKKLNPLSMCVTDSVSSTFLNGFGKINLAYSNQAALTALVWNVSLLKLHNLSHTQRATLDDTSLTALWRGLENFSGHLRYKSNLVPHFAFNKSIAKTVLNSFSNKSFQTNLVPWYYNTLIRFMEDCSGKKVLFQFYPFINQEMTADFVARYRRWLPRMSSYERNLGHRFFLEEALHIMHLSFILRDPKIIATWLKAMILRISFWKTRSIFRFIKYLFHNYFRHVFPDINIKGLKIRLKGKISAAGNSRKRTILYRIGKTSHSQTSLRVLSEFTTINTFTGVMGFSVWLFY